MLDFALKLTTRPGEMGEEDVNRLREAGLSDQEILHLVQVTGYFNYVNRIALALRVKL